MLRFFDIEEDGHRIATINNHMKKVICIVTTLLLCACGSSKEMSSARIENKATVHSTRGASGMQSPSILINSLIQPNPSGAISRMNYTNWQDLGKYLNEMAIKDIAIDHESLWAIKQSYINANDIWGYSVLIESLPDKYEIKDELKADLAFTLWQQGYTNESISVAESLNNEPLSIRNAYHRAFIYELANRPQQAIDEYTASMQIREDPYQYEKVAEILEKGGDTEAARIYREKSESLKKEREL